MTWLPIALAFWTSGLLGFFAGVCWAAWVREEPTVHDADRLYARGVADGRALAEIDLCERMTQ